MVMKLLAWFPIDELYTCTSQVKKFQHSSRNVTNKPCKSRSIHMQNKKVV